MKLILVIFCTSELAYISRVKSVQPDPDYDSCLVFLRKQAERLGLEHHTTEMVKGEDFDRILRIFFNLFYF